MKSKKMRVCVLFFIMCVSLSAAAQKAKTLTVLHTNDVHSRIDPLDSGADTGKGGFIRIASYIKEQRQENPGILLFDCGDFSQGTPFYNLFGGEVEMKLMNTIGYDAGTIGNHEFDTGLENMARLFRLANHPIVCANYDVSGTVLEGLVKPYVILKKNGLKIGVFGLGTQLEGMVQADKCEGITYLDPISKAGEVAALLKKKGCDVVICLSHLGLNPSSKDRACDTTLAKKSRNIDIIIGGHSHTYIEKPIHYKNLDGKDVCITQMGKNGVYVGRLQLTFN